MEKDKLLRNIPLEIMDRVRRLSARLWAENNPVAVPLSVIIEEFDADVGAVDSVVSDYEKHYETKLAGLRQELQAFRERTAALEADLKKAQEEPRELRMAIEHMTAESNAKYSKEAVMMLEQQILELKRELTEFRQMKGRDDHKIMELEAMLGTKTEEVERRYLGKTTMLEKECAELRAANEELEKSKHKDDASIRSLRSALEQSERESREKYTRAEIELLEQQILDLKKEISNRHKLKDMDDRRIAELEERLKEKTDDIERRYIGKITLLETNAGELTAEAARLQKENADYDQRIVELRRQLAAKEHAMAAMHSPEELKAYEEMVVTLRQELASAKTAHMEAEKRIAALQHAAGEKTEVVEQRFIARIGALENRAAETERELAAAEAANAEHLGKIGDLKKAVIAREREILELKSRISDAEMEYSVKLAGVKESYFNEQRKQAERISVLESDASSKLDGRRAALEEDYRHRVLELTARAAALESEAEAKRRELESRKQALEEDFAASKRELVRTFDKVREEIERREAALAARETGKK